MIKSNTYLISVLEASKATGFPIRKWIQWILLGLITSEPELNEDYIKCIPYASTASNVFIPITALPKYYREAYLRKTLIADLLSFKLKRHGSFLSHIFPCPLLPRSFDIPSSHRYRCGYVVRCWLAAAEGEFGHTLCSL